MMMTARIRTGLELRFARALVALGLTLSVVSFAGCGGSSSAPPKLMSIAVAPANATVAKGATQQFTATGTYSDKTTKTLTAAMVTWSSTTTATATVSPSGLATGVAAGMTSIVATSGAITGSAALTVTAVAAKLVSIAVTPAAPTVAKGTKQQFTATGTFDDNTTQNLTATVTWASATAATATIAATGEATAVAAGTTVISATSGTITGMTTLTVSAAKLVSIAVTPAAPTVAKGTKQQFTATGTFDDNTTQNLTAMATWASATAATATISATGEATAVAAGTTVISATSGTITGMTTLTVSPAKLVSIAVTPTSPTLAKGTKQQFTATGTFDDNTTQNLTAMVTWASATAATATISTGGEATAVAAGTSVISATSGTIVGMTTLTVSPAKLVSIAVTPATPSIVKGTKLQLTATGVFDDTTTQNLTAMVTWASATGATASISNTAGSNGEATALAPGTTVISATSGTISGMVTLTVTSPPLVSIAITPATPTIAKGTTQQLTATATFGDNTTQNVTSSVTWASATEATATISNAAGSSGLATAVAVGTTVISASVGAIKGMVTLTVTAATLSSIAVTPAAPTIAKLTKLQFVATGTYSDATTQDITSAVTWASATAANATISNAADSKGLATGVAAGTSVISATSGSVSGSTTLTVTAATLISIAVTPALPTIAKGTKKQFTATGFFSDATTQDVTLTATWASDTETVATISSAAGSNGLATGVGVGDAEISATIGAVSGVTTLKVSAALLTAIAVTPATPSIAKGTQQQFVATGTFTDSSKQDMTDLVTWGSATAATATISNADGSRGLASALAQGTTVISATSGTFTGMTTLTVNPAALVSLAVTPADPSIAKGTTKQFIATGTFTDGTTQDLSATVTWASATTATATISNAAGSKGLASGVGAGTSVISATSGAISGNTTLTVTPGTLVSIAVTPATPSIAKGTTKKLVATGTYNDATTQDLTDDVTWASATEATATISNADGSQGLATAVAPGTSVISATLGAIKGMTTLTVTNANLTSIAVTPAAPSIAKGTELKLTATGFFDDATVQDVTDAATWASATPATATVSNAEGSAGLVSGEGVGASAISATLGAIKGMTTLTVTMETLVSLAVTPAAPSVAKGSKVQFVAKGTFTDNSVQDLTGSVTWASATVAIATISNANGSRGLATTIAEGSSVISATSGAIKAMTTLTVTAATLSSITVTPAAPSIAKGTQQQFVAKGTFSDATTQDLTPTVTWASATGSVATISNAAGSNGLASTLAEGTTVISATSGTIKGMVTLTVTAATLVSITVTPANPTIAKTATQQFVATGTFTDATTQDLTAVCTWTSETPAIATMQPAGPNRGQATGVAAGTTVITATRPMPGANVSGHTSLTVTP